MKRFAFAIENNVGNATYGKNLARGLAGLNDVESTFLPVDLIADDVWQLVPVINRNYALTASARAAAALYALEWRTGLDAALVHSQSIALFCLELMRRIPTIISSDGTPANMDRLSQGYNHRVYGRRIEQLKHAWTKQAIRGAGKLLGWSNWVAASYVNDYGATPEQTVVIPPGVDTALWKPDRQKRPDDGTVRVLFTGGAFERKGGDILLRWARETRNKNIEVHIVSSAAVPETPRVIVHRNITANARSLVELAQRCDVFALPTRGDCFSLAGLEAGASGLPLAISDVGGISEIIQDGVNGYLSPPGDDVAFFERLDHLVAHPELRERMGEAGRGIIERRFDARRNAASVLEVMHELS